MKEKEFYELEEIDKDLNDMEQDLELLKGYDKLIKKVKEIKEKLG